MTTKPIATVPSLLFILILLILIYILPPSPATTSTTYIASPTYDDQF